SHHLRFLHSFPTRRSSDLLFIFTTPSGTTIVSEFPLYFSKTPLRISKYFHSCRRSYIFPASSSAGFASKILLTIESASLKSNARSEEHTSELQSRFDLVCR